MTGIGDAVLDLLLGDSCVGCGRPGRLLCPGCAGDLPDEPFAPWPAPPPGLLEPWAAATYDTTVRALVLGLKENRLLALTRPLGALLAGAVAAAIVAADPHPHAVGRILLVPVPSRPAAVRARGHDPTHAITATAARLLRRRDLDVRVARLLTVRRGVRDQSGLDAAQRAANLAGSMRCSAASRSRARRLDPRLLVVCDDVLTTGSTAREAQRVLGLAGLPVGAVAAVAATQRRFEHRSEQPGGFSADLLSSDGPTH